MRHTCHVGPLGGADELGVHHKLRCSGVQVGAGVQEYTVLAAAGLVAHCMPLAPRVLLPFTYLLMCPCPSGHLHTQQLLVNTKGQDRDAILVN